jgi:hypothetical protein
VAEHNKIEVIMLINVRTQVVWPRAHLLRRFLALGNWLNARLSDGFIENVVPDRILIPFALLAISNLEVKSFAIAYIFSVKDMPNMLSQRAVTNCCSYRGRCWLSIHRDAQALDDVIPAVIVLVLHRADDVLDCLAHSRAAEGRQHLVRWVID